MFCEQYEKIQPDLHVYVFWALAVEQRERYYWYYPYIWTDYSLQIYKGEEDLVYV